MASCHCNLHCHPQHPDKIVIATLSHCVRFGKWRSSGAAVPSRVCIQHHYHQDHQSQDYDDDGDEDFDDHIGVPTAF